MRCDRQGRDIRRGGSVMRASKLLHGLRHAGFRLEPTGDRRILVQPYSKLSDADRRAIIDAKPELLRLLSAESPGPTIESARAGAIARACELRNDRPGNAAALIAECSACRSACGAGNTVCPAELESLRFRPNTVDAGIQQSGLIYPVVRSYENSSLSILTMYLFV